MVTFLRAILIGLIVLVMAVLALWCALALWFQLPAPMPVRAGVAATAGLVGLACLAAQFTHRRLTGLGVFAALFIAVSAWWSTILPPAEADWSPDVARQTTGTIEGDILTVTDIRDFDWHSNEEYTVNWRSEKFDLTTLISMDMFMSYWGGPEMAHMILSFGFEDGRYLAWSVEVRRRIGGGFSPVADFFKTNTLAILAASERDVVGVRSNVRGEDVQLFRLTTPPEEARVLLEEYIADANQLAREPAFYNSIFTNCTTTVFKMIAAVGAALPMDWRLVVNGYLPDYVYDHDAMNSTFSLNELRDLGRIAENAQNAGLNGSFSQAIRVGVPTPSSDN